MIIIILGDDMSIYLYIKEQLDGNIDIKFRHIKSALGNTIVVFIDDLSDKNFISEHIIEPIRKNKENISINNIENIVDSNTFEKVKDQNDALYHILSGDVVIIFDELDIAFYCDSKMYAKRGINIPITESVIKGPREGFSETLVDNICLLRKRLKTQELRVEPSILGSKSKTSVVLIYVRGIADERLVNYIKGKMQEIDDDFILDTSYIEEKLKHNHTLFDTIGYSEKPDGVIAKIMEGRVAILVDGSPFALTAPHFFVENFQTQDDYYSNRYYSNVMRVLRYIALFIATFLPGLYLSIVTYHFSLIPSVFVFRLAVSRAGVPFPTVIEVIMMMIFFQLIKEAGIRLPQPIGQAMSIVGALILGDAAVGAGLASQITILIVAISTISYFLIPNIYGAISVWSMGLVICGSLLGLPGFYMGFFVLISHLASLTSCGYPYLFPFGTVRTLKFKDTFYRKPLSEISNNIFFKDDVNDK